MGLCAYRVPERICLAGKELAMHNAETIREEFAELVFSYGLDSAVCQDFLSDHPEHKRALELDSQQFETLNRVRRVHRLTRAIRTVLWCTACVPLLGLVALVFAERRAGHATERSRVMLAARVDVTQRELTAAQTALNEQIATNASLKAQESSARAEAAALRQRVAELDAGRSELESRLAAVQKELNDLRLNDRRRDTGSGPAPNTTPNDDEIRAQISVALRYLTNPVCLGYAGEETLDHTLVLMNGAPAALTRLIRYLDRINTSRLSGEEQLARATLSRAIGDRPAYVRYLSAAADPQYQEYVISDIASLQLVALDADETKASRATLALCEKVAELRAKAIAATDECVHLRRYLMGRQALWNLKMLGRKDDCIAKTLAVPVPRLGPHHDSPN